VSVYPETRRCIDRWAVLETVTDDYGFKNAVLIAYPVKGFGWIEEAVPRGCWKTQAVPMDLLDAGVSWNSDTLDSLQWRWDAKHMNPEEMVNFRYKWSGLDA
jgi:hypothetical protein